MSTPASMIIKVEDASSRDPQLEQATSLLQAKTSSWGILVTRVDFTTFTIALSPDIPFGVTMEMDLL
jgi:hypothetical protein